MIEKADAKDPLSVLILSTSLKGGAGGSAYKLHQGLQRRGIDSRVLVKFKYDDDDSVIRVRDAPAARWMCRIGRVGRQDLEGLPLRLYTRRDPNKLFSVEDHHRTYIVFNHMLDSPKNFIFRSHRQNTAEPLLCI